jgi:integrase
LCAVSPQSFRRFTEIDGKNVVAFLTAEHHKWRSVFCHTMGVESSTQQLAPRRWRRRSAPEACRRCAMLAALSVEDLEHFNRLVREAKDRAVPAEGGETCNAYFKRHATWRELDGVRDVRKERTIWNKWLSPSIGDRPVVAVTREEVEAIREHLDAQVSLRVREGLNHGISGDTAQNIWSVLRTMFRASVGSRHADLRVRTADPASGIARPVDSPSRAKTFLYPIEFWSLVACVRVPRRWREIYAIAAYTYVRPEELEALVWSDVDWIGEKLSVSKSVDGRTHEPKGSVKTRAAVREVPIEPELLALLERMHSQRQGQPGNDARIVPAMSEINDKHRADLLRKHLREAGVTQRDRIFESSALLRPIDFRSLRDTGITWLALRGETLQTMRRRAGHKDIETTDGYIKMAEDETRGVMGVPFSPLPDELIRGRSLRVVPEEGIEPPLAKRSNRPGLSRGYPKAARRATRAA